MSVGRAERLKHIPVQSKLLAKQWIEKRIASESAQNIGNSGAGDRAHRGSGVAEPGDMPDHGLYRNSRRTLADSGIAIV
jgi:hypothetical protein